MSTHLSSTISLKKNNGGYGAVIILPPTRKLFFDQTEAGEVVPLPVATLFLQIALHHCLLSNHSVARAKNVRALSAAGFRAEPVIFWWRDHTDTGHVMAATVFSRTPNNWFKSIWGKNVDIVGSL